MNRRHMIIALCAGMLAPCAVLAQDFADQIVSQLRSQGYGGITVSNTWLGRTRITAQSGTGSREIIIDPRTGEILRDLFVAGNGNGNAGAPQIVDDRSGRDDGQTDGQTGGQNDGKDDGEDDDKEDKSGESGGGGGGGESHGGGGGGGGGGGEEGEDD